MGREGLSHLAFGPAAPRCPGWGAWCCSFEQAPAGLLPAGAPPGCAGSAASLETLRQEKGQSDNNAVIVIKATQQALRVRLALISPCADSLLTKRMEVVTGTRHQVKLNHVASYSLFSFFHPITKEESVW